MDVIASVCHKDLPQSQATLHISALPRHKIFKHAVDVGRDVAIVGELDSLLHSLWRVASRYHLLLAKLPMPCGFSCHLGQVLEHLVGFAFVRVGQVDVQGGRGGHVGLHDDRQWGSQFLNDALRQKSMVYRRPRRLVFCRAFKLFVESNIFLGIEGVSYKKPDGGRLLNHSCNVDP